MKLQKTLLSTAILGVAAVATGAQAAVIDDIKARGELNCIVSTGAPGFSFQDENGDWQGFDSDFCRATAAAIFGDADKVTFVPATSKNRFTMLNSGEGDVMYRNTTWTMSRDTDVKMTFAGVNYYDGQGFLVREDLGVSSATELDGASVCIQVGTTTELNLADYFTANNMSFEPVAVETADEGLVNYQEGRCDIYTTDASGLYGTRAALENPAEHVVLPEIISKEPLGPAVKQGDDAWADTNRWILNALISAEELGVNAGNVEAMAADANANPEIKRMLGAEGEFGATIGLPQDWAVQMIKAVGNYGEIFDRNIGPDTAIGIQRGLNAQWKDGGLLYSPPIR